jgi:RNA polymerase sigma-70 factor (ECF subfamily)
VDQRSDEELLVAHLSGEPLVFDALLARYANGVFAFLVKFVGNNAVADDLTQETFLQVHTAAATFDRERSFKPWLYTIAANKARDYLRTRVRRTEVSLDQPASGDEDAPSGADQLAAADNARPQEIEREETRRHVRRMIEQMPEHLRMILILGYYQQLPYADIAEILDIPVGTVKSRLHAAVQHFAKMWKSQAASV